MKGNIMNEATDFDPIATYELVLKPRKRERVVITALLGRPQRIEEGYWVCYYQIAPLDKPRSVAGEDAMQALKLGLYIVGVELCLCFIRYRVKPSQKDLACIALSFGVDVEKYFPEQGAKVKAWLAEPWEEKPEGKKARTTKTEPFSSQ
jgi:hypothetical protein